MNAPHGKPKTSFSLASHDALRAEFEQMLLGLGYVERYSNGWECAGLLVVFEHQVPEDTEDSAGPICVFVTDGTTEVRRYLGAVAGNLRALLAQLLQAHQALTGAEGEAAALQERTLADMVLKAAPALNHASEYVRKTLPKTANKLEELVVAAARLQELPWKNNPDGPARQLFYLLHQYIPAGTLERAVSMMFQVAAGMPGNDLDFLNRSWRDATGCDTPADARRRFGTIL